MTLPGLPFPARPTLAVALLAAALGACHSDRAVTGSIYPTDYRARHPIVLADGSRVLDVFVTGIGHIDPRQAADIDAFLLEDRRYGRGSLVMDLPRGVAPDVGAGVAGGQRLPVRPHAEHGVGEQPADDRELHAPALRAHAQAVAHRVPEPRQDPVGPAGLVGLGDEPEI